MDGKIVLSYETLFELLRLERSRTELQKLPDDYLEQVKMLIQQESSKPDKKEITLKNMVKIIEEIAERRERKVVMLSLDKSRTKAALIDFSKFLGHEKRQFDDLLILLERNRIGAPLPEASSAIEKHDAAEKKPENRMVRFISAVPRFVGPDLEEYGPYDEEDIATLPSRLVDVLIERKRVQEIQPM